MGARGPKPKNGRAATAAERQAAYRARRAAEVAQGVKVVVKKAKPPQYRRSRAQRWADAVATLQELQEEYQAWLDSLPEAGGSEATREALEAICEVDLTALEVEPPRGFGRD